MCLEGTSKMYPTAPLYLPPPFLHLSHKVTLWLQLFTPPPLLSGCTGRRWRRCPGGWPERPSPSCSPGRSLPRCGRPVAPPSAPRPGAECSAPPCLPGRLWAGRSLRKAVAAGVRGGGVRKTLNACWKDWLGKKKTKLGVKELKTGFFSKSFGSSLR